MKKEYQVNLPYSGPMEVLFLYIAEHQKAILFYLIPFHPGGIATIKSAVPLAKR
jgi:hypothetical protein